VAAAGAANGVNGKVEHRPLEQQEALLGSLVLLEATEALANQELQL
jgi:hypothetical protein